jgi:[ribosomal protein S18]-alanine N-acetyltransferase
MPTVPADFEIRPMRLPEEAEVAATMLVTSEPWITLRRDREAVLKILLDPSREIHSAVTGDEVIGVLILHLTGLLNGYLQTVAVREDWRDRGVGTRLIQFAEERIFRQSPNVFLCVSSFNVRAHQLYVRLGYEQVGELKDYSVRGHHEHLLRKTQGPWQPEAQGWHPA